MAPKVQKSKEQKAAAAAAGGRSRKKKWSKGKVREKLNNAVGMTKQAYERGLADIPKAKLITPAVVSDRLKVNGSIARQFIKHLEVEGHIRRVGDQNHHQMIYTRATNQ
uniref:40S ribosomal protein S25 n=1 Tax=Chromera velia CCMP2878 TaxID=1169474 RepID=A0A0G4FJW6_9ALVE|eukprot:Cvel_17275.t1-p1 / transcript=Cvel_17275.t1 / gene=Cvel_17275 / organism=Chromera_velia_CCMP2878 / gene_product=40S ribosomal protein S25, putative / transcript_product=40S ribosomal protein S25, putative / location=Cvel_scaffold1370:12996-13543(+) / protein_length=108 / sequence_SO=supercontig / SO=protein_coding / is_pseudo=false